MATRNILLPIYTKILGWFVTASILIGMLYFGDRTDGNIIASACMVVISSGYILLYSAKTNTKHHLFVMVTLSVTGIFSLGYLVFYDISFYFDYPAAVIKSLLFVLFFYVIAACLKPNK